jgi:hypothetical protein
VRSGRDPLFEDNLKTALIGFKGTQVIRRDLIVGASVEGRLLRGYMQNPYRANECLPRRRNRYTASVWAAHYIQATDTIARVALRAYDDTWKLTSGTLDIDATQNITGDLDLLLRVRLYAQQGTYFSVPRPDVEACEAHNERSHQSSDPKLKKFESATLGIGFRIPMSFLGSTVFSVFAGSRLEPSYNYLYQNNDYGPAHIAQLGWVWPF